jgi:hypothetical protein
MASIQVYKTDTFEIQRQKINQLSDKVDRKTTNVLFVSKSGNDANTGANLSNSKLTIKAALEVATPGTVIRVAAGTYVEDNPLTMPPQVSIVGSSLREVTVTPLNTGDLFYVNNGCYVSDMSYVGSANPGAIFAFDPVNIPYIDQSPYIQNCTNFIPDSIGMKIDGNNAIGPIKSMVVDSYTQYNANGIGAQITNEAYAQLVSMFTICTDKAIECKSGGSCDLTNSNSSFGNFGLIADGVSPLKYTANVVLPTIVDAFIVRLNLSAPTLYVSDCSYDNVTGQATITTSTNHNLQPGMDVRLENLNFVCPVGGRWVDASNLILANKQLIANEAVERMLFNNQGFVIPGGNQECVDDVLKIIDALAFNLRNGGNDRIYEAAEIYVNQPYLLEGERNQSVEVYNEVATLSIQAMRNESITIQGSHGLTQVIDNEVILDTEIPYCADVASSISTLITIITDAIGVEGSPGNLDGVIKNSPSKGGRWTDAYNLITRNKDFLASEAVDRMLANNPGFTIPNGNQECIDDALLIIEALAYNVKYGGNRKIYDAARIYVDQPNLLDGERDQASEVYEHIRDLAIQAIRNESIAVEGSHGLTQFIDNTITLDTETPYCSDVASAISTLMDIIIGAIGTEANPGNLDDVERNIITDLIFPSGNFGFVFTIRDIISPTEFTINVGPSRFVHEYVSGGYTKVYNVRPFDGQILYFDDLYYEVSEIVITNPGKGYTTAPNIQLGIQLQLWGINAEAVAEVSNGSITEINVVSSGRGYTNVPPQIIIDPPDDPNGVQATAEVRLRPSYLIVESSKEITETTNIQTAVYDEITGLLTAITEVEHNLSVGDTVRLEDLLFSCSHVSKSGRWIDASNLILANKNLIANEAVDRMLLNNQGFTIPGGNQECVDDVLKFIDAIAFNIRYGGNNRVYDAAALYVSQPDLINGERDQSVEVYNNVRDLAIQAMRNETITIQGSHGLSQVIDTNVVVDTNVPECADVASAITSLVFIITYAIGTEAIPGNLNGVTRTSGDNSSVQYFPSGAYGYEFQVISTPSPTVFEVNVGSSNIAHAYESGGTATIKDIYDVTIKNNIPYELDNTNIAYFYKQSRLLASSHAFQYIGSGTEITSALPQNEGVTISANETVSINGGLVVYTSTDQSGNFKIGDGVIIDQSTGTISGESYGRSLFATVTPFILALGG